MQAIPRKNRKKRGNRIKRFLKMIDGPQTDREKKIQKTTLNVEVLWAFLQFYLVLIISGAMTKAVKDFFLENSNLYVAAVVETVVYFFFQGAFLHYMLKEQGKRFDCNFWEYMELLGLREMKWSLMGTMMFFYHVGVFSLLLTLQWYEDDYYFTTSNYFHKDVFSLRWALSILFLTPFREEVFFRGCIFTTAIQRNQFLPFPILLSGIVFAGAHALNFFQPNVVFLYTSLQVLSSFIVGVFFCLRYLQTGSLFEPILLHIVNNACSSFLPQGEAFTPANPKIGIPMTCTLVMYCFMSYTTLQQLKKHETWGKYLDSSESQNGSAGKMLEAKALATSKED